MGKLLQFPTRIQQAPASVTATVPKVAPAPYVYETTADVAKRIRQDLKVTFPGVKFSVQSSSYSGGSSIRIGWTDGPKTKQVRAVTDRYEDIRRDEYGEILNGGNRYLSLNREYSREMIAQGEAYMLTLPKDHEAYDTYDGQPNLHRVMWEFAEGET